jgi:hypothetical protein
MKIGISKLKLFSLLPLNEIEYFSTETFSPTAQK